MRYFNGFCLVIALMLASLTGCSKENVKTLEDKAPVYEPVRIATAYMALIEKPHADSALLIGDAARGLGQWFAHAGVPVQAGFPTNGVQETYDLAVVSDDADSTSLEKARGLLAEGGVLAWMLDVRGVRMPQLKAMLALSGFDDWHLWMPGQDQWLWVGRKGKAKVRLSGVIARFAREGAAADLAKARCGTLPEIFAGYVGTVAEVMPAFENASDVEVQPAFFIPRNLPAANWLIADDEVDVDIVQRVRGEMRSMQRTRREVVEGSLRAAKGTKEDGEAAIEVWSKAALKNPRDLFLLERIDRLRRNADGFLEVGKVLQAMKCYETIARIYPTDASAIHNLGVCVGKLGRKELSEQLLARAKELESK